MGPPTLDSQPPYQFLNYSPSLGRRLRGLGENFLASKIFPKKKKGLGPPYDFSSGPPPNNHEPLLPLAHHPVSTE